MEPSLHNLVPPKPPAPGVPQKNEAGLNSAQAPSLSAIHTFATDSKQAAGNVPQTPAIQKGALPPVFSEIGKEHRQESYKISETSPNPLKVTTDVLDWKYRAETGGSKPKSGNLQDEISTLTGQKIPKPHTILEAFGVGPAPKKEIVTSIPPTTKETQQTTKPIIQKVSGLKTMQQQAAEINETPKITSTSPFARASRSGLSSLQNNLSVGGEEIPPEPLPEKKEKARSDLATSPIHTFKDDVSEVVHSNNESLASIAIAENEKKIANGDEETKRGVPTVFIGVASLFFLVAGGFIMWYFLAPKTSPVTQVEVKVPDIITTEEKKEISIYQKDLEQFITQIRTDILHGVADGTIKQFPITTKVQTEEELKTTNVTTLDFFTFIGADLPPTLLRAFEPRFMLGYRTFRNSSHPFLILKVASFDNAFAGMLRWETTMSEDLADIFGYKGSDVKVNDLTFSDDVIKNEDIRFLKDVENRTRVLYSFVDNKTLVITNNTDTLSEISDRLHNVRLVR